MAKLFPPGYQFADSNGDPIDSGEVNFYENGTTTDKGIFTDAALSTAATNPAPLDSAGRFNQGDLYGEGVYTVVLKDSAGSQIWSRDDFRSQDGNLKGSDVASANALPVDVGGTIFDVTGTTSITSLNSKGVGSLVVLQFDAALTLTHDGTDLILPGSANITTAAGDIAVFYEYQSGDWRCVSYQKADGSILQGLTEGTEQATTSGTTVDFTSIPSWAQKITINFAGVSTDGTEELQLLLGDSGGFESSGYSGHAVEVTTGNVSQATDAFHLTDEMVAGSAYHGRAVLSLEDSANNTWTLESKLAEGTTEIHIAAGSKSTDAALDRIRLTTDGTPDTFDAGAVNILYE